MSETPYVVGLTGGIGSGKSAAADLLAARGALVVDTDQIAHQLTAPGGAAMEPIREAFGNGVVAVPEVTTSAAAPWSARAPTSAAQRSAPRRAGST